MLCTDPVRSKYAQLPDAWFTALDTFLVFFYVFATPEKQCKNWPKNGRENGNRKKYSNRKRGRAGRATKRRANYAARPDPDPGWLLAVRTAEIANRIGELANRRTIQNWNQNWNRIRAAEAGQERAKKTQPKYAKHASVLSLCCLCFCIRSQKIAEAEQSSRRGTSRGRPCREH